METSCIADRKAHGILCTLAAIFAAFAAFVVAVAAFAVEELMDLADSVPAYHFLEYFPHLVECGSLYLIHSSLLEISVPCHCLKKSISLFWITVF